MRTNATGVSSSPMPIRRWWPWPLARARDATARRSGASVTARCRCVLLGDCGYIAGRGHWTGYPARRLSVLLRTPPSGPTGGHCATRRHTLLTHRASRSRLKFAYAAPAGGSGAVALSQPTRPRSVPACCGWHQVLSRRSHAAGTSPKAGHGAHPSRCAMPAAALKEAINRPAGSRCCCGHRRVARPAGSTLPANS